QPANSLHEPEEPRDEPRRPLGVLAHVVRKSGAEERTVQPFDAARANRLAVERRPASTNGAEELVAHRIVHDADLHPVLILDGDADREVRELVGVVRGPVQRVDDPPVPGASAGTALLREDGVLRMALAEPGQEDRLAGLVGIRDQVDATLEGDGPRLVEALGQHPSGTAGALDRGLQQHVQRDRHWPPFSRASTCARMSSRFPSKLSWVKRTRPVRSTTQVVGICLSFSRSSSTNPPGSSRTVSCTRAVARKVGICARSSSTLTAYTRTPRWE